MWLIWFLFLSNIKRCPRWWVLRNTLFPHFTFLARAHHPAMPTVLSIVLSLFGLFLLQLLLDIRRVARDVGFVCL
jgi:hypothetical protein